MVSNHIRERVRTRALTAASEKELGGIIYKALTEDGLDWREISSESVKQLLVDAVHAYRHLRQPSLRVAV